MLNIRFAAKEDIPTIKRFILELAEYEKLLDQVVADEDKIENSIFIEKSAHAVIVEYEGKPIGHAIFFYNFSTFLAAKGLYIEDIYVTPEMRHRGFGRQIFKFLANLAKEQDCGRMEWMCLAWNAPSIRFYQSIGGAEQTDWRLFRMDKNAILKLAES
jgi:GNAT superfamily N-acetyltransferase